MESFRKILCSLIVLFLPSFSAAELVISNLSITSENVSFDVKGTLDVVGNYNNSSFYFGEVGNTEWIDEGWSSCCNSYDTVTVGGHAYGDAGWGTYLYAQYGSNFEVGEFIDFSFSLDGPFKPDLINKDNFVVVAGTYTDAPSPLPQSEIIAGKVSTDTHHITIDFEDLANDTQIPSVYSGTSFIGNYHGIVGGIAEGDPGNWDLHGSNGSHFLGMHGDSERTFSWTDPVYNFSLDVSRSAGSSEATFSMVGFLNDEIVTEKEINLSSINVWQTVLLDTAVDSVQFSSNVSAYGVDNIQFSFFSSTQNTIEQIISINNTPKGVLGRTSVLEVAYDTTDNNNQLSGLGMRVHFDSSLISFNEITGLIEQDIIVDGQGPFSDDADFDNDPLTDQYMLFGWASLYNNWPDTDLPTILMNIAFDVSENINPDEISSTSINFTDTAFTVGYEFSAESYELEILRATWDFDGNGQADALSDGLMMLRYLFGLRGELVTNLAMSPESPLSSEEVVAEIEAAMDVADIDADGQLNALTDGLLLLRYLFGLRDDILTNGAVGPDATRSSNTDIQNYLESHMPAM